MIKRYIQNKLKDFINNCTSHIKLTHLKFLIFILFSACVYSETMNVIDPNKYKPEISARTESDKQYTSITHKGQIYNIKMGTLTGAEPGTYLYTHFPINTKGGGNLTFKYRLQTYDDNHGGDYANIAVIEPGSKQKKYLVQYLRSGYPESGNLYDTGYRTITLNMDKWKDEEAKYDIEFYLTLDGQGDNSLLEIADIEALGCDVYPIKPITDPEALYFENVNEINTEKLNDATKAGLACMENKAVNLAATFNLTSGYRPLPYQQHIYDVWSVYKELIKSKQPKSYCYSVAQQVKQELKKHKLVIGPAMPSANSPHVKGNAFDARITKLPSGMSVDDFAKLCEMYRRLKVKDPVHFEPIPAKWNIYELINWFSN